MNKKTLFLLALAILSITIVAGCAKQTTDTQAGQTQPITPAEVAQDVTYKNPSYLFSLVLPKNWGGIIQSQGDNVGEEVNVTKSWHFFVGDVSSIPNRVKLHDSIRLVAKNDPQRFIQIQIVKNEDVKVPSGKAQASNDKYTFYYMSSQFQGDAEGPGMSAEDIKIKAEISDIVKSFSLSSAEAVKAKSIDDYMNTYKKFPIDRTYSQVKQYVRVFALCADKYTPPVTSEICDRTTTLLSDAGWGDGKDHEFYFELDSSGATYFGPFKDNTLRLKEEASQKENFVVR